MALLSRSKKDARGTGKGAGKGASKTAGKAAGKAKVKQPRGARLKQIRAAWTMTRRSDPKVLPLCLAAFFGPLLLALAVGLVVGPLWAWLPLGFMVGLLATTFVFGRRVQKTAFAGVEGQPGAAAAVLNATRGDWRVTPAVGFNREQEIVHRVVGRPGVILVAEAGPTGVHKGTRNLVANEKKKLSRYLTSDIPVYDLLVGDEEGQIPLRGLEKHLMKLPRNIKPKQVNELDARLKAIPAAMPIPKGPMPTTGRMPRGKMR
jgi:hypothetical protein